MSMICYLLSVSKSQIGALRADPTRARDLARVAQRDVWDRHAAEAAKGISPEQLAANEARYNALAEERRLAFLNRMAPEQRAAAEARDQAAIEERRRIEEAAKLEHAVAVRRLQSFGPVQPALRLEKSWHMLHYLMNGKVYPIGGPGDVLLTGEDFGAADVGYGPPWLSGAEATRAFADFLNGFDGAELAGRLNLQEMAAADVYAMPRGRGAENEEPALRNEVGHFYQLLRDYVVAAASKGNGLMIWIS